MQIKRITATETPTYREFRCLTPYGEWALYRAKSVDGIWTITKPRASESIVIGTATTIRGVYSIANQHANSLS
jgi:hypothetical protein